MKSRKFKAVLAAVSAIAVLATAMTGFAANVTTTTIYNADDADKVSVNVQVTGVTENSEVTYLVKSEGKGVNNSDIVYIDQKTANSAGVAFNYQIAKSALNDTKSTVVTFGSDTDTITGYAATLGITALNDVTGTGYTISFDEDYYADDAEVTATVAATGEYEIKAVTVDGTPVPNWTSFTVAVDDISKIEVDAQLKDVTPEVTDVNKSAVTEGGKVLNTVVMKVNAMPKSEVGVVYNNEFFPAHQSTVVVGSEFAVQLIADTNITESMRTHID